MSKKIAVIGAGSIVFCKTLVSDILGVEALADCEIALKYGVDQCIGDSLGPGGLFRGLRTIPVLVGIASDMQELAKPNAMMLQYPGFPYVIEQQENYGQKVVK